MILVLGYGAVVLPFAAALIALLSDLFPRTVRAGFFLLLAACGGVSVVAGVGCLLTGGIVTGQLGLGLPGLAWHLRLDPLSGFFLAVTGIVVVAVACYGPAYVRQYQNGQQPLSALGFFTGIFVAGMQLVLLANDVFLFMLAWEIMSLSSYFLVTYQHQHAANRRAGFLYLLMAEGSALLILLAFGILAAFAHGLTFGALRAAHVPVEWATAAFVLALLGFGLKAGLVPFHVWLPEAHPVAPSHISALMSGLMLKVAVYGFIRFVYGLVVHIQWRWGLAVLILGTVSALFGVLYAIMQHDLKRLLAYHSVENIGIIFMGLGLSMIFIGTGHPVLGVLGLIAALYHTLNHALFKSLLFLGSGAILLRTHEGDLEHMGGLIRRMPQTALLFLIGCLSISALPPFNGFVSEWLTFQTALQVSVLSNTVLRAVLPVSAALLALTGALAATCFVKVYGVAFLGRSRTRRIRHAREVAWGMRVGMGLLALLCLVFGILPTLTIRLIESVPRLLLHRGLPSASVHGWLWLTPVSARVASYSAPLLVLGLVLMLALGYGLLHPRRQRAAIRRSHAWDCGFGGLTPRMQYTSTAFSMPIRRIFSPVWTLKEQTEVQMDDREPLRVAGIRYQLQISDRIWPLLYEPMARGLQLVTRRIGRIQTGRVRTYLAYSFFTLLLLLWLVR